MMRGRVNDRLEPKITLQVYASDDRVIQVEALVDTGCSFFLVLEKTLVEQVLRLPYKIHAQVRQGDGSIQQQPIYEGRVEWEGALREVNIVAMGDEAIIGMEMLRSCHWQMDVNPGGELIIS